MGFVCHDKIRFHVERDICGSGYLRIGIFADRDICGYCYLVASECRAECSVFDFGRFALNHRRLPILIEPSPDPCRQLLCILKPLLVRHLPGTLRAARYNATMSNRDYVLIAASVTFVMVGIILALHL